MPSYIVNGGIGVVPSFLPRYMTSAHGLTSTATLPLRKEILFCRTPPSAIVIDTDLLSPNLELLSTRLCLPGFMLKSRSGVEPIFLPLR